MISCIICSKDNEMLMNVSESIANTIGVPYEVIGIENSDGRYGLCSAYNTGASRAKHDYLCFIHEDIVFHTQNWGKNLLDHFENLENVGIIGIAGSIYKSFVPSGWWSGRKYASVNLIQAYKFKEKLTELHSFNNEKVRNVICLDGVFLALNRKVFEEVKFDENLHGFHGYDSAISLATSIKYKNYFVPDILIEHFSEGKVDDVWIENVFLIFRKWKNILPVSVGVLKEADKDAEFDILNDYCSAVGWSTLPVTKKTHIISYVLYHTIIKFNSPFKVLKIISKKFLRLHGNTAHKTNYES